ncbi:MAG: tetratricopeptide repeat protein [Desulfococcaceae bacterium]
MPLLGLLSLIIQIYFAVHAVQNGKDRYWVYIIILFPGAGSLIYFFAEFLPDLRSGSGLKKTKSRLVKLIDPGKEVRRLEDELELSDSVKNRLALARGYVNAGMFDKAVTMYESCLQGIHRDDPVAVEGLCCAYFFQGNFAQTREWLLHLRQLRGGRKGDEFDLLLARCCEELGDTDAALEEYAFLEKAFTGEEARCRYALLLKKMGKTAEAQKLFQKTLKNVKLSPGFHKKNQKQWVDIAKREA